ncbi:uncharacterized protein LOC133625650 [Colius striatus]|uniref:uncharacterized protein LOC133625650 n=1 Tax=Colius striatus TaxID=57412 RepID=UPI002B1E36AD|nr:uncharacterized protein LOC133625650 [Colius striatus]
MQIVGQSAEDLNDTKTQCTAPALWLMLLGQGLLGRTVTSHNVNDSGTPVVSDYQLLAHQHMTNDPDWPEEPFPGAARPPGLLSGRGPSPPAVPGLPGNAPAPAYRPSSAALPAASVPSGGAPLRPRPASLGSAAGPLRRPRLLLHPPPPRPAAGGNGGASPPPLSRCRPAALPPPPPPFPPAAGGFGLGVSRAPGTGKERMVKAAAETARLRGDAEPRPAARPEAGGRMEEGGQAALPAPLRFVSPRPGGSGVSQPVYQAFSSRFVAQPRRRPRP